MRKAIKQLKSVQPDFVVAEFFYGYGNNYSVVNMSNLYVFLYSLPKFSPQARVIVLVDKAELQYAHKLADMFPIYAVLPHPVTERTVELLLQID